MKKFLFFLMSLAVFAFTACEEPGSGNAGGNGNDTTSVSKPAEIDPNTVLTLSPAEFSITPGEQKRITPNLNPQPTGSFNMIWTSSDNNVATVAGAVVTGVASGKATITAQIEGTDIKASVSVKVGTPIENVEFSKVQILGYKADMLPLSVKGFDYDEEGNVIKDENGDTIWNEITDINDDGTDDYFIKGVAYIMPSGMTYGSDGLSGTSDYLVFVQTSIIFDGTYIYPAWNYKFSSNPEEYLTEEVNEEGKQCMKWRYATYTNFSEELYGKYWYRVIASKGDWPSSQEEYDAYMAENYYMGDLDSYVAYFVTPDDKEAYATIGGLVSGGSGFGTDLVDGELVLSYLDIQLDFFDNFDFYGLAIEGEGDQASFVPVGEGENAYFKMADMITRTFSFDNRSAASAPRKALAKGMTMKRMEANILTNLPMVQMLPR